MAVVKDTNAYWDVSSNPQSAQAVELDATTAFKQSVFNLISTPIGDRGPIGDPQWGNPLDRKSVV